jgi:phosphatidate cytidylyltransferase
VTVEGSIGCIAGGTAITVVIGLLLTIVNIYIPLYHLIILGLLISIVAQYGDLMASSIKRQCGIKDFGTIMPGHGGILDRIDSILFVTPLFYFYVTTFLMAYIK